MTDLISSAPEIIRAIGDSPVRLAACILLFICVLISVVFSQLPTENRTSVIWGAMLLGMILFLLLLFSAPSEIADWTSSPTPASSSNLAQKLGNFLWSIRPRLWWCPSEFGTIVLMFVTFFWVFPGFVILLSVAFSFAACVTYIVTGNDYYRGAGAGDGSVLSHSVFAIVAIPILVLIIDFAGWCFSPWWCLISK
jgi:hypothetical protein